MKTSKSVVLVILLLLAAHTAVNSQTASTNYPARPVALPDAQEIALAESAAPATIGKHAAVYTIRAGQPVRIREGSNGVTCMVARDLHPGSLYPICFDAEGSRTHLWRELMEVGLRSEGKSEDEVKDAVKRAFSDGKLKLPEKMSVSYMMSPHQVLFSSPNANGRRVGAWWPHLMISAPDLSAAAIGITTPQRDIPFSVDGEGGREQLIVQLPSWSDGSPVAKRAE